MTSIAVPSPAAARLNSSVRLNAFASRFDISRLSRMSGDVDGASCLMVDSDFAGISTLALEWLQVIFFFSSVALHSLLIGMRFSLRKVMMNEENY
jgi:hypothetical protein